MCNFLGAAGGKLGEILLFLSVFNVEDFQSSDASLALSAIWNLIRLFHKERYCRKLESQSSSSSKWKKSIRKRSPLCRRKLSFICTWKESSNYSSLISRLKKKFCNFPFLCLFSAIWKTSTLWNRVLAYPRVKEKSQISSHRSLSNTRNFFFSRLRNKKLVKLHTPRFFKKTSPRRQSRFIFVKHHEYTSLRRALLDLPRFRRIVELDHVLREGEAQHARTPSPPGTLCRSRHRHRSSSPRALSASPPPPPPPPPLPPPSLRTELYFDTGDVATSLLPSTERVRRYFVGFIVHRHTQRVNEATTDDAFARSTRPLIPRRGEAGGGGKRETEGVYLLSAPSDASRFCSPPPSHPRHLLSSQWIFIVVPFPR